MSKQQWKFNLRFTLCLAGALLVLGVSLYFWHAFSVRRNSTALLHRADQLREQRDLKAEAKTLRSYLSLNPLDDAVLARLALTLDESADDPAKKAAAVQVLYRALAQPANSQRADLRRRQLRLLWETRRFEDAIEQSQYVLKVLADPDDALHREALVVQALAEVDSAARSPLGANWSRIVGLLGDAIAANPPFLDHLELANRLATVYSDETVPIMVPNLTDSKAAETLMPMADRRQRAGAALDELVAKFPDVAEAHLARYRYRQRLGTEGAEADLERAMALATDTSLEVWLGAGEHFRQTQPATQTSLERAENCYKQAVAAGPKDRRGYLGLARTYQSLSQLNKKLEILDQAIEQLKSALKQIDERDFDLNITLARLLNQANRATEAAAALNLASQILEEKTLDLPAPLKARAKVDVERLRGEMFADKGDFGSAIATLGRTVELERAIPPAALLGADTENTPLYTFLLLGRCYESIGNPDQAALAFDEALTLEPQAIQVRLAAARAWESAGRADRARAHYETLLKDPRARELMPATVAQLLARKTSGATESTQNLDELRQLIDKAEQSGADVVEICLLRVNLAVAQNDLTAAGEAVAAAERVPNLSPAQIRSIALAYETLARPDDSDRAWQLLEKSGNSLASATLRADLLRRRGLAAEAEDYIVSALDRLKPEDQEAARLELAQIAADRGRTTAARDYLLPSLDLTNPNVRTVRQFAQLAANLADWPAVERAEQLLKRIEGESGTQWRFFRALRLATNATGADDPKLQEAETLRQDIERLRPGWTVALQLEALVAEKKGNMDAAIAAYRRLIESESDLNQRSFATSRYLALTSGIAPTPQDNSSTLPIAVASSPALSFQALAREVAGGNIENAVKRAEDAAQQRPTDAMAQIWLAQTLLLASRRDEAERAFDKAIQLAPNSSATWSALLGYYEEAKQPEAVRALAQQFEANGQLPEPQRSLFLARLEETSGNSTTAAKTYDMLLQQFPENSAVVRQAVGYWAVRDDRKAEAILRRHQESRPRDLGVRRVLARILAARGDNDSLREAFRLLSGEEGKVPREDDDRRLYVEILARQGSPASRREAIEVLRELQGGIQSPPARGVLTLAALYELDGQYSAALAQLADLAGRPAPAAEHVVTFADFLLRHKETASPQFAALADGAIKRLESVQPLELRTLALRLRWLAASSRDADIDATITKFAEGRLRTVEQPEARAETLRSLGALCEQLQLGKQAEAYYRQAAASDSLQRPALARFLANTRTAEATTEALALCDQILAADPGNATAAIALCLAVGSADTSMAGSKEPALEKALQANLGNADVLQEFARLRFEQQRFADAAELLRKVVALNPTDTLALNNLAYTLAVAGGVDEAESLINKVLGSSGPVASYRDTQGLVLLLRGRNAEALELFADLARSDPTSAILGHLAVAQNRAGKLAEAKQSYDTAVRNGLDITRLPKCEQDLLSELKQ